MTPEMAARLRSATLAQVHAYRRARVYRGEETILSRWHVAKDEAEKYPNYSVAQQAWQTAQTLRVAYEAGLAEIDAIIAEKAGHE